MNPILEAWNKADNNQRTDFIGVFCQLYNVLICQVLRDIGKCCKERKNEARQINMRTLC